MRSVELLFFQSKQPPLTRYQPGTLNSSSQMEKLVELVGDEKVAVSGADSGDEYSTEMEDRPLRETFTPKLLFCPSRKTPTQTSGTIVYATTAIICKLFLFICFSGTGLKKKKRHLRKVCKSGC